MSRCIGVPEFDSILGLKRHHKSISGLIRIEGNRVLVKGKVVSYTRKSANKGKTKRHNP